MNEDQDQLSESPENKEISYDQLSRMGFLVRPVLMVKHVVKEPTQKTILRRGRPPVDPNALRLPQLRVLGVMGELEADSIVTAVTFDDIARRSGLNKQSVNQSIGPVDASLCDKHDKIHGFKSLISRGLVVCSNIDGSSRFYLTQLGQGKLEELEEEIRKARYKPVNNKGAGKRTKNKEPKKQQVKRAPKRVKKNVEIQDIPTLE